jgi:phosphoglycerate dehydrogenase-like enzyme
MLTLRGATMGVIGLGGIGREVARLSRAAGMRVIGTRRPVTAPLPDAGEGDLVLPAGRILRVAAESDFLVVCSQLTAGTRGFINAQVLAAMKPNAVLINVARGEEVDEDALVDAVTTNGDTNVAEPLRRLFADNLRRYLDGQPLRNVVDRARGY